MTKPTKAEVGRALELYRGHSDKIVHSVIPYLPKEITHVATVDNKFAFVQETYETSAQTEIRSGTIQEIFYNCDEFFLWANGKKPNDKKIYELSIDMILNVEKYPFIMVNCSQDTRDYLYRICRTEQDTHPGRILVSRNTKFLEYSEEEIRKILESQDMKFHFELLSAN